MDPILPGENSTLTKMTPIQTYSVHLKLRRADSILLNRKDRIHNTGKQPIYYLLTNTLFLILFGNLK